MRLVLLGDSHLARVRRRLPSLGDDVLNLASGGSTVLDLPEVSPTDLAVVSVGTNDAAPGRVDLATFADALRTRLVGPALYVAPPGVVDGAPGGRTNAVVDTYRDAALAVCAELAVPVVRADLLVRAVGPSAYATDGLHLSGAGYDVLLPAIAAAVRSLS